MNQQQTEKIKGLIKTSRILIESERAEWLSLLELMNDKQLGELEKILNSGQQSADSNQQKSVSGTEHIVDNKQPESLKFSPPTQSLSPQPNRPRLPQLSHIMNLPKNIDGQMSALKLSQKTMGTQTSAPVSKEPVFPVGVSSKTVKARQSFGDKLKAMFAEKELPAGIPKNELSLPAHTESSKPAVLPEKPMVSFPLKEKPTVITASQVTINGPVTFSKQDEALGGGMIISSDFKKPALMTAKLPPAVPKPLSQPNFLPKTTLLPQVAPPIRPEAGQVPSIKIQETSEQVRQATLATIKQRMNQPPVVNETVRSKVLTEKPVELHLPKDLTAITATSFQNTSLENFVIVIRQLVEKFGYYDVIFSLEKSPLYEAYIKTGTELMNRQQTFETFDSNQSVDKFLNREDFEKFTDLLRQIASG